MLRNRDLGHELPQTGEESDPIRAAPINPVLFLGRNCAVAARVGGYFQRGGVQVKLDLRIEFCSLSEGAALFEALGRRFEEDRVLCRRGRLLRRRGREKEGIGVGGVV